MALGLHTELEYYWEIVKIRDWGSAGPDQIHTLSPNCHKRTEQAVYTLCGTLSLSINNRAHFIALLWG